MSSPLLAISWEIAPMAGDETSSGLFNVTVIPLTSPATLKLSGLRS
ncbi:MAG: hypothetical protein AW07_02853 [Candidatus Accumulibacter sp. SK-11]|nr:MAG: hypothetical protein AW07_02853 [Candidatus Accumulibacter sp. SK-11]